MPTADAGRDPHAPGRDAPGRDVPGRDVPAYDQLRRRILWSLPSGLYLLGSRSGGERNLMTTSWATQLCIEPKLVGVSVEASALTHRLITEGGAFTLCLLPRAERAVVRRFAKPAVPDEAAGTLSGVGYFDAPVSGAPVPSICRAYLDCSVTTTLPLGSHTLFVGEVLDAAVVNEAPEGDGVLEMGDTRMSYGG